ncbi:MAG: cell division protein FtsZ [Thermoprotei archaeon]|nr:MAG: cell division protein FtsZ [Thermoprotei archaeon]
MSAVGINPKIAIVGIGGCGCNTLNRLYEVGIVDEMNIAAIAVHTELVHLRSVKVRNKILIGETVVKGHGCGGNIALGEEAMKEDVSKVITSLGTPDVVIVTGGLGGGTASGGMSILLEEIGNRIPNALRIAVVTLPFSFEGMNRIENAKLSLGSIISAADLTIVHLNDILLKRIGTIPVQYAFKFMDTILVNTIKGIVDIITKGGIVSISFSDFVSVVKDMKLGVVGHGVGTRISEACANAVNNVLLDADLKEASAALLYVEAPSKTTLEEASEAPRMVTEKYGITRVYWGFRINDLLERPRVMLLASGVRSPTVESLVGSLELL